MQLQKIFAVSVFGAVVVSSCFFGMRSVVSIAETDKPVVASPEVLARGEMMFNAACSPCHGTDGAGEGPLAVNLQAKPRDFTKGVFKNRSTASGQLPTDYDVYRNITSGIHNTAMPAFQYMSPEDRWAVVQFIKTFSKRFSDPNEYPLEVIKIGQPIPPSLASLEKGRGIYIQMKCWDCHGVSGEGNGPSAGTQVDDFGNPIRSTDLTNPSDYKFARSVIDVYRIFSTGLNGTPMPSYASTLNEEERWHLANYVWSLQDKDQYQDGKELKDIEVK